MGTTVAAPKLVGDEHEDPENDFGTNMFKALAAKRTSVLMPLPGDSSGKSRSIAESRFVLPAPIQTDKSSRVDAAPTTWNSQGSSDKLLVDSPSGDRKPSPAVETTDEDDASLLHDTLVASKWLGENPSHGRAESIPLTDMRGSRSAPLVRPAHRFPPSAHTKVMTPAQFEKYRQDMDRQGRMRSTSHQRDISHDEDDDGDKYDDDEDDEAERSRQAAKDRNKRQAHMALYRQQMTKMTGETSPSASEPSSSLFMSGAFGSSSTPNLLGTLSPDIVLASEDDGDDDVPLAILSEHGFPSKTRPPMRPLNSRASYMPPAVARAQSSLGSTTQRPASNRHSTLPAFARNLPQDPFSGPGQYPRESLPYGGGLPAASPQQQFVGQAPVGGLVGVIMNEERSRAMRRGSPQPQVGMFAGPLLGYDPSLQMAPQVRPTSSIYGLNAMAAMSQPSLNQFGYGAADPNMQMAQMQMVQQQQQQQQMMQQQHMMQQQLAQMQMMQQTGGGMPGLMPPNQMAIRHSVATDSMRERPRFDAGMRTMSMVQPSSASWVQQTPSIQVSALPVGYTPSIAPSERSTVGLPGRYRPVSQAIPVGDTRRVSSMDPGHLMSGALGAENMRTPVPLNQRHSKSEPRLSTHAPQISLSLGGDRDGDKSDDEDEAWAALNTKREKTKSMWKKASN